MASVLEFDLGPFAADPDALLIALVGEIADRLENAPEPGLAIHRHDLSM